MQHRSRRLSLCAAIAVAAGLAAAPAAAQLDITTEIIASDGFFFSRPSIGVDSQGNVHVVYSRQDTSGPSGGWSATAEVIYATNASGSWTYTQITNNDVREELPVLVVDSNDNVHIAFHSGTGAGTRNEIRYINNVNGPFTGNEADIIKIAAVPDTGTLSFVTPQIAVDSMGRVHFVFEPLNNPKDIYYARYDSATGTLGDVLNINNTSTPNETEPYITVGPDDVVHITYRSPVTGNTQIGYFRMAQDYTPVQIATNVTPFTGGYPIPTVGANGRLGVIHRQGNFVRYVEAEADGTFAATPEIFDLAFAGFPIISGRVPVGPDGRRYVGYITNNSGTPPRGAFLLIEPEGGFGSATPESIYLHPTTADLAIPAENDVTGGLSISVDVGPEGTLAIGWARSFRGPNNENWAAIYISTAQIGDTTCPADFDGDGTVNTADITAFLSAWFAARAGGPANGADFDGDGTVNTADITAFLSAWFTARAEGC